MKPRLLVHPSQARSITSPEEVERLIAQGWVIATRKSASRAKREDAMNKRTKRDQLRADGWLELNFWMSPEAAAVVAAVKQKGESYAACLERLARLSLL